MCRNFTFPRFNEMDIVRTIINSYFLNRPFMIQTFILLVRGPVCSFSVVHPHVGFNWPILTIKWVVVGLNETDQIL